MKKKETISGNVTTGNEANEQKAIVNKLFPLEHKDLQYVFVEKSGKKSWIC